MTDLPHDPQSKTESHPARGWRHAFGAPVKPILAETDQAALDKLTATIRQTGYAPAARVFYDAHQPLAFIAGHLLHIAQPVAYLFGRGAAERLGAYGRVLESGVLSDTLEEDQSQ